MEPRRHTPRNEAQERAYHLGMAAMCQERGLRLLARSHEIQADLFLPDRERAANLARCRVTPASVAADLLAA